MPKTHGKYSLDELLAAKRRERPTPQFWENFDRELRTKERRLLQQQQPIEACDAETAVWPRFRKAIAVTCAAVSCGAFGFLTLRSLQTETAHSTSAADTAATSGELALSAPPSVNKIAPRLEPSDTVPEATEPVAVAARYDTPKAPEAPKTRGSTPTETGKVVVASASSAQRDHPEFALDIQTPFEEIDVESTIAFKNSESLTSQLARDYIDPVGSRGYKTERVAYAFREGLSRVSAMTLDSGIIDRNSRWGLRLDEVNLKF